MAPDDRTTRLICPLTADTAGRMRSMLESALRQGADAVEFRLDFLRTLPSPQELAAMLKDLAIEAIVTCRPVREGGRYAGDESARVALLKAAAKLPGVTIDLEHDVPLSAGVEGRLVRSRHDFHKTPADLDAIFAGLAAREGIAKVAFTPAGPQDALRALDLLRSAPRPAIVLAMGEAGLLSRVLARKFGAYGTFAALSAEAGSAPGQPTIDEFKGLYRWDSLGPATEVYGVIGCPIAHSMSPRIHNAAFTAVGRDAVYVPLLIQPGPQQFNAFLDAVLARPWLDWRGLSVTIPHKENALVRIGAKNCEELAVRIGAINTIALRKDGTLRGDNTDYAAAMDALCAAMGIPRRGLSGRPVSVLGAGGAARAIVAALRHYGASVAVYNRTVSRAEALAEEFGCQAGPLEAARSTGAEILINCTSVGMDPEVGDCPLATIPGSVRVVFDTIYNPVETQLIQRARAANRLTVTGVEMFVNQAVAQFEIWTGTGAPRDVMRRVVMEGLSP